MYQATHLANPKHSFVCDEKRKNAFDKNPALRGKYRFDKIEATEPKVAEKVVDADGSLQTKKVTKSRKGKK